MKDLRKKSYPEREEELQIHKTYRYTKTKGDK